MTSQKTWSISCDKANKAKATNFYFTASQVQSAESFFGMVDPDRHRFHISIIVTMFRILGFNIRSGPHVNFMC